MITGQTGSSTDAGSDVTRRRKSDRLTVVDKVERGGERERGERERGGGERGRGREREREGGERERERGGGGRSSCISACKGAVILLDER